MHFIYELNRRLRVVRQSLGGDEGRQLSVLGLLFLMLMVLHVIAMMVFEGMTVGDAIWLTITTATTVGYGDYSAVSTGGRLATIVLMYLGGIFVLAQLGSLVFELSAEKREQRLSGKLSLKVKDHIIFFGWRQEYVTGLIREIRSSLAPLHKAEIVIVSEHETALPGDLRKQKIRHVVGPYYDPKTFEKAALQKAAAIVIIPEGNGHYSDFLTVDLIERLQEQEVEAPIIAELLNADLIPQARRSGPAHVQLFNPNYPDMLARSVLAPGTEAMFDEIIKDSGTEMVVLRLAIRSTAGKVRQAVMGLATLLAFQQADDSYVLNPDEEEALEDYALVFLVDTRPFGSDRAARRAIADRLQPLTESREVERFELPRTVGLTGGKARVTEDYLARLQAEVSEESEVQRIRHNCWSEPRVTAEVLQPYEALILLSDDPQQANADAKTFVTLQYLRQELGYAGRIIVERYCRQTATVLRRPGRVTSSGRSLKIWKSWPDASLPERRKSWIIFSVVSGTSCCALSYPAPTNGRKLLIGYQNGGYPLATKTGRGISIPYRARMKPVIAGPFSC